MNWQQALAEIEGPEFDARLNVVSGLRSFLTAVVREPAIMELYNRMQASGDVSEEVLGNIYDLSRLSVDPRYEHPKDTAMAALLWLMAATQVEFAELAAHYVDRAPQSWYAKKLARRIIIPAPVESGDSQVAGVPLDIEPADSNTTDGMIWMDPFVTAQRPVYRRVDAFSNSTSG